ncbi:MAG: hypothetical protein ACFFD2_11580 [Promethearchaeota archaeon]
MESQLLEMINYFVKQQFIKSDDIITDRTKYYELHITGSSRVVNKFIKLFTRDISCFIQGKYKRYLKKLCDSCRIEIEEIYKSFSDRIDNLEPENTNQPLIFTSLIGEFLGKIRECVFKQTIQKIKDRVKNRLKITEKSTQKFEEEFKNKIEALFQCNEPNISLLYNLSFLEFITKIVHSNKVKRTSKILLGKHVNRVVKKICQN